MSTDFAIFAWFLALAAAFGAGLLLFAIERVALHVTRRAHGLSREHSASERHPMSVRRVPPRVMRRLRRVWLTAIR